jgi:hypothetical protein
VIASPVPLTHATTGMYNEGVFEVREPTPASSTWPAAPVSSPPTCAALNEHGPAGMGLDGVDREPLPLGNAVACAHLLVAPHISVHGGCAATLAGGSRWKSWADRDAPVAGTVAAAVQASGGRIRAAVRLLKSF